MTTHRPRRYVEIAEAVYEARVGGHIYDRGVDGTEYRWARVLSYDPPHRVVFTWDISSRWQIETDRSNASEVEMRFIAETADRTRVELEHPGPSRSRLGESARGRRSRGWLAALLEQVRGPLQD